MMAAECEYPLHLGLTERVSRQGNCGDCERAGRPLQEGIGDTIRASLTPSPAATGPKRWRYAAGSSSLELRSFTPQVTAVRMPAGPPALLPGNGRRNSDVPSTQMREWKERYVGVEDN